MPCAIRLHRTKARVLFADDHRCGGDPHAHHHPGPEVKAATAFALRHSPNNGPGVMATAMPPCQCCDPDRSDRPDHVPGRPAWRHFGPMPVRRAAPASRLTSAGWRFRSFTVPAPHCLRVALPPPSCAINLDRRCGQRPRRLPDANDTTRCQQHLRAPQPRSYGLSVNQVAIAAAAPPRHGKSTRPGALQRQRQSHGYGGVAIRRIWLTVRCPMARRVLRTSPTIGGQGRCHDQSSACRRAARRSR